MVITLTTDFGQGSPYVAAMKGVILAINPAVTIVDLTHSVAPQNVRQGAVALAEASVWFPAGTIHVAVVDPGVGTIRKILYAQIGDQHYVAPDNGLLGILLGRSKSSSLYYVENPALYLPAVSATFHGRDVMAPVAAQLSLGIAAHRLGPRAAAAVPLNWPEPKKTASGIMGVVTHIDSFGNCITNISAELLPTGDPSRLTVELNGRACQGLIRTYGDRTHGELVALMGSSGWLELAVVGGSAAALLSVQPDQPVLVRW